MCSHDDYRPETIQLTERPDGTPVWMRGGDPRELLDLEADLDRLAAFYDAAAPVVERPDAELFGVHEQASAWSAGQHLFHVCLANELALRNVRMIAEGTSGFLSERAELSLVGQLVLPVGAMPRGLGRPPRAVTPPAKPDPGIVRDTFASNREDLAAARDDLRRIAAATRAIKHADLGQLGAGHWIRFAGIHGWHHLEIATEVLDAA